MSENLPTNANETLTGITIEALTASGIPANRMILELAQCGFCRSRRVESISPDS